MTPEMKALKMKVMKRSFALVFVALMSVMVGLQLAGYSVDTGKTVPRLVGVTGILGAATLVFDKYMYLPFLGPCVLPPTALEETEPRTAAFTVDVRARQGASHIVYWASESSAGVVPNPWDAYGNYGNAGVTKVTSSGTASLAVKCPGQYKVRGKVLPRHVHYREVFPSGVMSEVKTVGVDCL